MEKHYDRPSLPVAKSIAPPIIAPLKVDTPILPAALNPSKIPVAAQPPLGSILFTGSLPCKLIVGIILKEPAYLRIVAS